jgi:2-deoxy-D-gluconate 3-dehydrogenase
LSRRRSLTETYAPKKEEKKDAHALLIGGSMAGLLAGRWAVRGITVNCLCPSYFTTAMARPVEEDPAANQQVIARTPMARWGRPEELDGPIIFLASPASSFVTGIALYVDGGWSAH